MLIQLKLLPTPPSRLEFAFFDYWVTFRTYLSTTCYTCSPDDVGFSRSQLWSISVYFFISWTPMQYCSVPTMSIRRHRYIYYYLPRLGWISSVQMTTTQATRSDQWNALKLVHRVFLRWKDNASFKNAMQNRVLLATDDDGSSGQTRKCEESCTYFPVVDKVTDILQQGCRHLFLELYTHNIWSLS